MIQYTSPTPRRRWPGVLLFAVVLVVFLILISACGSGNHDSAPKPAPVTTTTQPTSKPIQPEVYESHTGGDNWPQVRSYCDPDVDGVRIYVSDSKESFNAGGAVSVIADPNCNGR